MDLIKEYPNYSLYKYAESIYLIESIDNVDLGMLFLRVQETMDHPKYRNTHFDLIEFVYNYQKENKNVFDYCKTFVGYNITSRLIEFVYINGFQRNMFDLQMEEIYKTIRSKQRKGEDQKPFFLMGILKGDKNTLKHELHHAFFDIDRLYRKNMLTLVKELRTQFPAKYKEVVKDLKKLNYAPGVMKDEIAAYLSTDVRNTWKVDKILHKKFKQTYNTKYTETNG